MLNTKGLKKLLINPAIYNFTILCSTRKHVISLLATLHIVDKLVTWNGSSIVDAAVVFLAMQERYLAWHCFLVGLSM